MFKMEVSNENERIIPFKRPGKGKVGGGRVIQNGNTSNCPQIDDRYMADGDVLGYCDVITYLDHQPNRVPEFLMHKKCKSECTGPCAVNGYYWCKQIYMHVRVKINGDVRDEHIPSDCLCVKDTKDHRKIHSLYGEHI
ncbi:UNVERIFIED_CONTAM: hypothetical protein PYX00_005852 [Menopon gallinae]|uniref:Uncharacterized protein n=1 Tax=Menopon gallinae TaxID=328185 RepID=A0AAW2HSU4_9NEOP